MKFKTALLGGVSLVAMTSHAQALEAIGSLVISSLLAVGAGGILPAASAAAIGAGAISIALGAANLATSLLFKPPSVDPQAIKNTTAGAEGPGRYATGRVELAAKVGFGNTAGYQIFRLLLHCFGPIAAVEEYSYDGREITVDSDGTVSSPPWVRSGGNSYLRVQTKIGDGAETAWPQLISAFPSLWTSAHRARGVSQTLLQATNPGTGDDKFLSLYQGGVKELKIRARVGRFYDPRNGSTVWTINGVLQCLYWLRMLPGMKDEYIDLPSIGPVATQGEQAMGSTIRCPMSGGWEGPLTYDVVGEMLKSCGLEVRATAANKLTLAFIEDNPASEVTITASSILAVYPQAGPEGAKRPNVCKLRYFSPERKYEMADLDLTGAAWARVQSEIDVYGEQEFPVELTFCCDSAAAQRIARQLFHMARADYGVVKTDFGGLAAWGRRAVTVEIPDLGDDGESLFAKCVIDPVRVNDGDGTCEIPFRIVPEILKTPWNPATDERPAPPVLQSLQYESELPTPVVPGPATLIIYPDNSREVRLRLTPVSGATIAEATYRQYVAGEPTAWTSMDEPSLSLATTPTNLEGQQVDFRVRYFNLDDEASYNSPALAVASLAVDNTQTAAPNMSGVFNGADNSIAVTVVAPASFNVARVLVERNTSGTTLSPVLDTAARPGQVFNLTYGSSVTLRARAFTSNGTASPTSNYTYG